MAEYSLLPKLTDAQKRSLGEWIGATLADEELAQQNVLFPLSGNLAVYVGERLKVLHRNDIWQDDGSSIIYLGYGGRAGRTTTHYLPLVDRLAVVGAIISVADLWATFSEQYMARTSAVLIGSYRGLMSGLVQSDAAISGLAFNVDQGVVAARVGDHFHLANGAEVEVDDSWVVVNDRPPVRPITP